jgi:hypothetical protein
MKARQCPALMRALNELIDERGSREVFKALVDIGLSISIAQKLAYKRYPSEPRGTTRTLLDRYLSDCKAS